MPPQRAKKQPASRSNTSIDSDVVASFPAPPANTTPAAAEPSATTPDRTSPSKRTVNITEQQKQVLMDNLQLEITERARKLRSQYGLLAQGLRSRLEMRVNRIPTALRKTNILDLIEKYSEQPGAEPPTSTIARPMLKPSESAEQLSPVPRRGIKRTSEERDQENADQDHEQEPELVMPKKRTKTTGNQKKGPPAANSRARTVSRQDQPLQVLSPKSNNSRTYPLSPLKVAQDEKIATRAIQQMSPLKSNIFNPSENPASKGKATAGTGRGKKAAATHEKRTTRASLASSTGSATDGTTGTTIVKKAPATKKTTARSTGTTKSAGSKSTAAAKKGKENAPAAAAGRTLRTRAK
ncbi:borealin-like protein [Diplodia corticola]|uniref:Borealin-like protein n=1 Tax=Diplodia corticola TaxID=236234 RepID=A0A1J9RMT2_9PEZI|nr:borealin-like protein [Diplodia corticola]OJD29823.1 borealin-like protein [Diplodia corticola]